MNWRKPTEITYLLLRLAGGWMFFQSGAMKVMGLFGEMPPGTVLNNQMRIGGWLEVFGGLLIMAGLGTRVTAFILSGMMAVAYWQFHAPQGTWPVQNDGLGAALYCFVFLYMAARGGGDYSLDALIASKKQGDKIHADV